MASRRLRAVSSLKISVRICARSSEPSTATNDGPNSWAIAGIATPFGAVMRCAITSVSTSGTPSAPNLSATVDLPLPMPPVNPTANMVSASPDRQIERRADKQRERAAGREKRTERQRLLETHTAAPRCRESDHGAGDGRHQHDLRQRGPAEPGAERGEQLEIAVAHSFDATHQPEYPMYAPQHEIPGDRADYGIVQAREEPVEVDDQPRPQQRQRDRVGQQVRIDIDYAHREQRGAQAERGQRHQGRA